MQVVIDKLVSGARGMCQVDGRPAFISGVLPGERVECHVFEDKKAYSELALDEILVPSDKRILTPCPYSGVCGGCDFDLLSGEDSALAKELIVKDTLTHIAKLSALPPFLPPAHSSDFGYRVRARFHVDMKSRKAGFLEARGRKIIPIEDCPRLSPAFAPLLKDQKNLFLAARDLMFQGKISEKTGYTEVAAFAGDDGVSVGEKGVTVSVGEISYRVNAAVFFQSNLLVLPSLFDFIKAETVGNTVMDLYSGVGTFSALFEGSGKKVIAVERQKQCLALARRNAPSAESFTDDVALWAKRQKGGVDTVIVDPPRVGLGYGVPEMIASWCPQRIIYVSCNAVTLARDLGHFTGYHPVKAQVLDFYPGSSHEESVIALERD